MGRSGPRPGGTLATLQSIRRHLEMDASVFNCDGVCEGPVTLSDGSQMTPTEFVCERTENWLNSWILPGLDRLIAKELKKRQPKEPR